MLEVLKDQKLIKLYVIDGTFQGPYFKDGPQPESRGIYETKEGAEAEPKQEYSHLEVAIPKCLEKLFKGQKILPYNLPSWLQPWVKITRVEGPTPTVDMDIDVGNLYSELHRQSVDRIGSDKSREDLEKAKDFMDGMLVMSPADPLPLYNLACAESLLGNTEAAVAALQKAAEVGYANWMHMERDVDLQNIRHLEGYQAVLRKLRGDAPVAEVKQEKKVEEPKKEEPKKEEPVVEKKVETPKIECKWPAEHQILVEMGFDPLLSKEMLEVHGGNLDRALNSLMMIV